MARTTIFEESLQFSYQSVVNSATCNFSTSEHTEFDFDSFSEALSDVSSIYFSIDQQESSELPKIADTPPSTMVFGEMNSESSPVFENYPAFVGVMSTRIMFAVDSSDSSAWSSPRTVKIEIGEDDPEPEPTPDPEPEPTPSKKAKPIGVKEAMKHYISTTDIETPADTIKKLTKQILTSIVGEDDDINNARTIAEIYEAAAIKNGYDPSENDGENEENYNE